MFSKRTLMVLGVALFIALIAVWFAKRWVEKSLPATTVKTVKVVVANDEIPFASRITESQLKLMEWPKGNLPASYLSDPKEIVNKISTRVIYSGEVINKVQIREHLGGSPLSALIEENMRAMTVRVNDVVGVSGFILPGNFVDVLATPKPRAHYALDPARSRENQNHQTKTYVAVQNVKVLAVDQEAGSDKDKPTVRKSVTLQVMPEQAEKLATATAEGTIQLMLRNPSDKSVKAEPPTAKETTPTPPPEPPQAAAPEPIVAPPPKADKSLLIIKGTTKNTVSCTELKCESSGSGQGQYVPPYRAPLPARSRAASSTTP